MPTTKKVLKPQMTELTAKTLPSTTEIPETLTPPASVETPKPRLGRKPVPENETTEQKLARLGNARVTKAISAIGMVGNLAAYKPTDTQIDKIITALAESCQRLDARLRGTRRDSYTFTID